MDTTITSKYRTRTDCRLCGSQDLKRLVSFGETAAANAYRDPRDFMPVEKFPLRVRGCLSCGHVQLGEVVNPELLFTNYKYATGVGAAFKTHFANLAKTITRLRAVIQPTVLEVGANDGTLLRELKKCGLIAVGIDPSPELAGSDVTVIKGFFNDETHDEALGEVFRGHPNVPHAMHFDLLVANNVLAHIDDLGAVFKLAHSKRIPVVMFEVQSEAALLEKGLFDMVYHEHLDYHSVPSLVTALPRWGYLVTAVDKIPTHGGSIRVTASRISAGSVGHVLRPSDLPELLHAEGDAAARFSKWVEFKELFQKADLLRDRMRKFNKVILYGAPAKLTTFAHVMLSRTAGIHCVVDDSPWKQGLMTPDGRWLICSPDEIRTAKPDAVLVTAWNFFDAISEKLHASGYTGEIINPFA